MRYVYKNGRMVRKGSSERTPGPYVMGDLKAYRSPLGTGEIDGRYARREDMKRGNCREVDPSERLENPTKSRELAAKEKAYQDARLQSGFSHEAAARMMRG